MSALTRMIRKKRHQNEVNQNNMVNPKGGTIYKAVNYTSITGLFIVAGLLVLAITKMITFTANLFGILVAIGILCFACMLILPWIRRIEKKEWVKTSMVFVGIIAACAILWIIADILAVSFYKQVKQQILADKVTEELMRKGAGTLKYVQISVILTIQASFASFVGTYITKYRATMIPFQVIAYVSYLIVDVWTTIALLTVSINQNAANMKDVFALNSETWKFLLNKVVLAIFILSVVYSALSKAITERIDAGRRKNISDDILEASEKNTRASENEEVSQNAEDKLAKIKTMYEKELITKEEYEAKRAEILKDL